MWVACVAGNLLIIKATENPFVYDFFFKKKARMTGLASVNRLASVLNHIKMIFIRAEETDQRIPFLH